MGQKIKQARHVRSKNLHLKCAGLVKRGKGGLRLLVDLEHVQTARIRHDPDFKTSE